MKNNKNLLVISNDKNKSQKIARQIAEFYYKDKQILYVFNTNINIFTDDIKCLIFHADSIIHAKLFLCRVFNKKYKIIIVGEFLKEYLLKGGFNI